MPYTADVDTIASKVVKGDHYRIITGSRDYAVQIDSVKVGDKWTVAREADGQLIFRKLNTEQVWVMREVPTDEEIAAKKIEDAAKAAQFRIEMLERMHERMHNGIVSARTKVAAELAAGNFVSASIMEDLLLEQEYKNMAVQLDAGLTNHDDWTIVDCMEALADRIKEALLMGYNEPTQSGGFTFSNADRQLKIAAQRKFLQGINWGML